MHTRSSDRFVHEPLISVVTVCLNAAKFIRHCISSVVEQEFKDFEYIIIDGGSTDGTVRIIEQYQDKLAYWHSKPDRGLAHAFNMGIEKSTGRWITFLNADDYYAHAKVLSSMAKDLTNHPDVDLLYGQIVLVERKTQGRAISSPIGDSWSWKKFRRYSIIPHPATFTQRSFIERYGQFSEEYQNALDYELYLRAGKALRAIFVPYLVSHMRVGGMSKKYFMSSLLESRRAQIENNVRTNISASAVFVCYLIRGWLRETSKKLSPL